MRSILAPSRSKFINLGGTRVRKDKIAAFTKIRNIKTLLYFDTGLKIEVKLLPEEVERLLF